LESSGRENNAVETAGSSPETTVNSDTAPPEANATTGPPTAGDATDGFFGFVVGLYAAALLAPAVLVGVAGSTTDPGVLFFVLLGTVVAVTGGVGRVARRESLAVRLGATRWVWAAMVLPSAYFGVPLVADQLGSTPLPDPVVPVALLGAIVGVVAGIGLVAAAHNRHAKAVLADAETLAEFTAPAPSRDRRIAKWAVVGLFAAGFLGFVGSLVLGFDPLRWLFQMLVPLGAGLWGSTTERKRHGQRRRTGRGESRSQAIQTVVGLRELRRDRGGHRNPTLGMVGVGSTRPASGPRSDRELGGGRGRTRGVSAST
jgi:hypothetical protein